ncbi:hypothetical protein CBM2637_A170507 [Cupriavidus taiwanensis]|nr:hypothetical protein CBM2637_A170507 [Cupriavidus taiwanensis]
MRRWPLPRGAAPTSTDACPCTPPAGRPEDPRASTRARQRSCLRSRLRAVSDCLDGAGRQQRRTRQVDHRACAGAAVRAASLCHRHRLPGALVPTRAHASGLARGMAEPVPAGVLRHLPVYAADAQRRAPDQRHGRRRDHQHHPRHGGAAVLAAAARTAVAAHAAVGAAGGGRHRRAQHRARRFPRRRRRQPGLAGQPDDHGRGGVRVDLRDPVAPAHADPGRDRDLRLHPPDRRTADAAAGTGAAAELRRRRGAGADLADGAVVRAVGQRVLVLAVDERHPPCAGAAGRGLHLGAAGGRGHLRHRLPGRAAGLAARRGAGVRAGGDRAGQLAGPDHARRVARQGGRDRAGRAGLSGLAWLRLPLVTQRCHGRLVQSTPIFNSADPAPPWLPTRFPSRSRRPCGRSRASSSRRAGCNCRCTWA